MKRLLLLCCLALLCKAGSLAQPCKPVEAPANRWTHPSCKPLPTDKMGPFVRLATRQILTVDDTEVFTSADAGKTWLSQPLFKPDQNLKVSRERAILRTRTGTLVLVFINMSDLKWGWDQAKNQPIEGIRANVWVGRAVNHSTICSWMACTPISVDIESLPTCSSRGFLIG